MKASRIACLLALSWAASSLYSRALLTEPVGTSSATQTATVTITTAGTLQTISVLTHGAIDLDFNAASGGTCSVGHTYAVGNTCTVNCTFKPTRPWIRYGGVALFGGAGNLLGNTYLTATGTGPQPIFISNNSAANLATGSGSPDGVAVDGNGNIYVAEATGRTSITRSRSRWRNPASQPERPKATTRNLDPIIARRSSLSRLSVVVIRHLGSQPAK